MRIIYVLLAAITLLFMITVGWWVSLPIVLGVSNAVKGYYTDPIAVNIGTAVEYVAYIWGPLFDVFIMLWVVLSSTRRDVESEVYGY